MQYWIQAKATLEREQKEADDTAAANAASQALAAKAQQDSEDAAAAAAAATADNEREQAEALEATQAATAAQASADKEATEAVAATAEQAAADEAASKASAAAVEAATDATAAAAAAVAKAKEERVGEGEGGAKTVGFVEEPIAVAAVESPSPPAHEEEEEEEEPKGTAEGVDDGDDEDDEDQGGSGGEDELDEMYTSLLNSAGARARGLTLKVVSEWDQVSEILETGTVDADTIRKLFEVRARLRFGSRKRMAAKGFSCSLPCNSLTRVAKSLLLHVPFMPSYTFSANLFILSFLFSSPIRSVSAKPPWATRPFPRCPWGPWKRSSRR